MYKNIIRELVPYEFFSILHSCIHFGYIPILDIFYYLRLQTSYTMYSRGTHV